MKEEESFEDQEQTSDITIDMITSKEPSDLVKINKSNQPARIVVHPREKKYSCKICSAQFYSKSSMKKHEEGHTVRAI